MIVKDESKSVCCYYTDIQLGLYIFRGDTTVLLGEVDDDIPEDTDEGQPGTENVSEEPTRTKNMIKVSLEDFETLQEKIANEGNEEEEEVMEALRWEFDMDLVV